MTDTTPTYVTRKLVHGLSQASLTWKSGRGPSALATAQGRRLIRKPGRGGRRPPSEDGG